MNVEKDNPVEHTPPPKRRSGSNSAGGDVNVNVNVNGTPVDPSVAHQLMSELRINFDEASSFEDGEAGDGAGQTGFDLDDDHSRESIEDVLGGGSSVGGQDHDVGAGSGAAAYHGQFLEEGDGEGKSNYDSGDDHYHGSNENELGGRSSVVGQDHGVDAGAGDAAASHSSHVSGQGGSYVTRYDQRDIDSDRVCKRAFSLRESFATIIDNDDYKFLYGTKGALLELSEALVVLKSGHTGPDIYPLCQTVLFLQQRLQYTLLQKAVLGFRSSAPKTGAPVGGVTTPFPSEQIAALSRTLQSYSRPLMVNYNNMPDLKTLLDVKREELLTKAQASAEEIARTINERRGEAAAASTLHRHAGQPRTFKPVGVKHYEDKLAELQEERIRVEGINSRNTGTYFNSHLDIEICNLAIKAYRAQEQQSLNAFKGITNKLDKIIAAIDKNGSSKALLQKFFLDLVYLYAEQFKIETAEYLKLKDSVSASSDDASSSSDDGHVVQDSKNIKVSLLELERLMSHARRLDKLCYNECYEGCRRNFKSITDYIYSTLVPHLEIVAEMFQAMKFHNRIAVSQLLFRFCMSAYVANLLNASDSEAPQFKSRKRGAGVSQAGLLLSPVAGSLTGSVRKQGGSRVSSSGDDDGLGYDAEETKQGGTNHPSPPVDLSAAPAAFVASPDDDSDAALGTDPLDLRAYYVASQFGTPRCLTKQLNSGDHTNILSFASVVAWALLLNALYAVVNSVANAVIPYSKVTHTDGFNNLHQYEQGTDFASVVSPVTGAFWGTEVSVAAGANVTIATDGHVLSCHSANGARYDAIGAIDNSTSWVIADKPGATVECTLYNAAFFYAVNALPVRFDLTSQTDGYCNLTFIDSTTQKSQMRQIAANVDDSETLHVKNGTGLEVNCDGVWPSGSAVYGNITADSMLVVGDNNVAVKAEAHIAPAPSPAPAAPQGSCSISVSGVSVCADDFDTGVNTCSSVEHVAYDVNVAASCTDGAEARADSATWGSSTAFASGSNETHTVQFRSADHNKTGSVNVTSSARPAPAPSHHPSPSPHHPAPSAPQGSCSISASGSPVCDDNFDTGVNTCSPVERVKHDVNVTASCTDGAEASADNATWGNYTVFASGSNKTHTVQFRSADHNKTELVNVTSSARPAPAPAPSHHPSPAPHHPAPATKPVYAWSYEDGEQVALLLKIGQIIQKEAPSFGCVGFSNSDDPASIGTLDKAAPCTPVVKSTVSFKCDGDSLPASGFLVCTEKTDPSTGVSFHSSFIKANLRGSQGLFTTAVAGGSDANVEVDLTIVKSA
jgi:hypothetical protein